MTVKFKKIKAFTLAEVLVSLFIITILVSVVVVNYNASFSSGNIINSQSNLFQNIKLAQSYALSNKSYDNTLPYYWGLQIAEGSSEIIFFADLNNNGQYDLGEADESFGGKTISLSSDIFVNSITWANLSTEVSTSSSEIAISFAAGSSRMDVYDLDQATIIDGLWFIELKDRRSDIGRLIMIESPAMVDSQACSCQEASNYCCTFCDVSSDCQQFDF